MLPQNFSGCCERRVESGAGSGVACVGTCEGPKALPLACENSTQAQNKQKEIYDLKN